MKCEVLCGNCHKLFTLETRYSNSIFNQIKSEQDVLQLKPPEYYSKKIFKEPNIQKCNDLIRVHFCSNIALQIYGKYPLKHFNKDQLKEAIEYRDEVKDNIERFQKNENKVQL